MFATSHTFFLIFKVSIDKGIKTTVKDMSMEGLARGINQIEGGLKGAGM